MPNNQIVQRSDSNPNIIDSESVYELRCTLTLESDTYTTSKPPKTISGVQKIRNFEI